MPREPPYFEAPYHSTDLNLEIGTGVTVVPAPITNPHRKSDGNKSSFAIFSHTAINRFLLEFSTDVFLGTTVCSIINAIHDLPQGWFIDIFDRCFEYRCVAIVTFS